MENKKLQNYILLALTTIVIAFLVVSTVLMINPSNTGIVIDRVKLEDGTRQLVYGTHNLALLKGLVIGAVVISSLVVVSYFVPSLLKALKSNRNEVKSRYEQLMNQNETNVNVTLQKVFLYVGIALSVLLIAFHSYILVIFPVDYDKYNSYSWALAMGSIILLLGIIMYSIYYLVNIDHPQSQRATFSIQTLTEGAIMVALAVILSVMSDLVPGLKLPNGGSYSLSMLPLFIYALRRGMGPGAIVGLVYSIVNFLVDGMVIHWGSIFFDYLLPYTLLGFLAGIFKKEAEKGLFWWSIVAVLAGGFARYIMHSLSGLLFFAEWAPEGMTAFYYSFIFYNLPYMAANTAICIVFTLLLHKRLITKDSRVV